MAKKKKKLFGVYYTQGKLSKKDREWICKMLEDGITERDIAVMKHQIRTLERNGDKKHDHDD